ncbi:glycosyltransferase family 2 protein [Salinibacterium sp. dk2585]|uniref:glycosyltransferase family 2 protein n=1 Tax=unclassified Salinibacterium TaxID=2632331 RepID=UPI0011C251AF|nr:MULTISPECIES: glycosyltransferase family 2 protein [unclassified Salinibacterium]QEE60859.1 glycosyltransferase family 2 protein [Salinibacterium sp. dk2585]TXK55931.1 glycosyltransferase family 2 protein [Salinibacterium sp. dk5596]
MTTISVALATYNGERFVAEQVESILAQSRRPDELLVADDGSTDATLDIIRATHEAAGSGVRLRVLDPGGRLGVTKNFERAVSACEGDLIVLSDQDDVWHPDRLERAATSFEARPGLLLQHSDARLVDADGRPLDVGLLEALRVSAAERQAIHRGEAFSAYLRRNLVTGATVAFRASLLQHAMPFPSSWVHDEWLAAIAASTGEVELIEEPLIDYRQHGANQIGATKPTLRYRISRMLEERGDRYERLATRAEALADRLAQLPVPDRMLAAARDRARFDRVRATLPKRRLARLGTVLDEHRAGSYRRLSSQGTLDVFRDILQPARDGMKP